ncbi:hypothetical protein Tco_0057409, partial [Tanacetum coccineum]
IALLDFVNSADHFKVKIGEQTLAENEVLLITETKDRVISPSPQTISLVDHTIQDELNVNVGKRKKRVAFVSGSSPMKKARTEGRHWFGSAAPAAEDATSSSVTPTLERSSEGDFRDNVRTRPSSVRFDVLSSSSTDTDIPTSPQIDNPVTFWNLLDHVTPLGYWAALRNQHDAEFFDSFNINSAQHVCMVFELRLRYEHEIIRREKYEKNFTDSVAMVQQKNVDIIDLKARLEKSEAEAAEVAELCKHVSDLEV